MSIFNPSDLIIQAVSKINTHSKVKERVETIL